MQDFRNMFTWRPRQNELSVSLFGLFEMVREFLNKDEDRWHYISYVMEPRKLNENNVFFHFHDKVTDNHFFLRWRGSTIEDIPKYTLFWSKDPDLFDCEVFEESGWETMEEFATWFEPQLAKRRNLLRCDDEL